MKKRIKMQSLVCLAGENGPSQPINVRVWIFVIRGHADADQPVHRLLNALLVLTVYRMKHTLCQLSVCCEFVSIVCWPGWVFDHFFDREKVHFSLWEWKKKSRQIKKNIGNQRGWNGYNRHHKTTRRHTKCRTGIQRTYYPSFVLCIWREQNAFTIKFGRRWNFIASFITIMNFLISLIVIHLRFC